MLLLLLLLLLVAETVPLPGRGKGQRVVALSFFFARPWSSGCQPSDVKRERRRSERRDLVEGSTVWFANGGNLSFL